MASEAVMEFTDDNFEQEVIKSDVPVLVDFTADWCQPCQMLAPVIDQLAEDYKGQFKVGKMDTGEQREVATRLSIQSIPTVLIFKGGEITHTFVGPKPKAIFAEALEEGATG